MRGKLFHWPGSSKERDTGTLAKQRKKVHEGKITTKWYLKVKDGRELKTG